MEGLDTMICKLRWLIQTATGMVSKVWVDPYLAFRSLALLLLSLGRKF